MRVVHVLCDLSGGGAERLVLDLCRRIPGVESSVVAVHSGGELTPAFEAAGVPVVCAARQRGRLGARALLRIAGALRGADLIHTHLWAGDTWGRLAALAHPAVPVVTTEHNVRDEPGRRRAALSSLLGHRTTHFVAVSEAAASSLRRRGVAPGRVSVIDNGVDLARFPVQALPEEPAKEPHRVLAVGRLVPQKGFDQLVEAAVGLPVELTVVGEGPERAALQRLAAARGVSLALPGWEPQPWRRPAHIAVVPSRWEGFGLTAVEALASGLPLIVSAAPPLPRLVGAAGAVVSGEPVAGLRGALASLLASPSRRRALAAAGPEQAARFSIERTAQRHRALYAGLVAGAWTGR